MKALKYQYLEEYIPTFCQIWGMRKFCYSSEFYFMAMITLDMIIHKETVQLLLRYQFKYWISQIMSGQI